MSVPDYKINYKSDFVLTINGDAGWAVPFCIKFWTGMPSQAYFVGFDGVKYVNCRVGDTPTQLLVMFDDHHLPIGKLMMQIAYHTTIEEFPGSVFDEVTNARDVIVTIDGTDYQVMLDFTGEDAPELEFDLPAYANEAERIQNELQRQQNEADRIAAELQREQATAAAVQGAENVNAQLSGTTLTVTNRQGVSTSVNTKGEQGEQGPTGPEGPQGEQGVSIVSFRQVYASETATYYSITFSDGHEQSVAIPKGAKGDTGATGPTGPQGPQGPTGVSITGFVETGETETDTLYNVTFSDGTTQAVAIPKGEKGDQGPVGPVGPQGPMGDVAVITPEQQAAFTMYSTTGQNTNGPMTQKAVTDNLVASSISYDNSQSGLASVNVQGALDEINILNLSENQFDFENAESTNPSSSNYSVTKDSVNETITVTTLKKISSSTVRGGFTTGLEAGVFYQYSFDYENQISGAHIYVGNVDRGGLTVGSGNMNFNAIAGAIYVSLPNNTASGKTVAFSNISIVHIDYLKDTVNSHGVRITNNEQDIAKLEEDVTSEPLNIPFSNMTEGVGIISPTNYTWNTNSSFRHYYFARTTDMKAISIQGNGSSNSYIAFLKSYNYIGNPSGTPDYCDGYSVPVQFLPNSNPEFTVVIPDDCNYIVVNKNTSSSQLPAAVYLGHTLKSIIEYKNTALSILRVPMEVGHINTSTGKNATTSYDATTSNGYAFSSTIGEFERWRNVGMVEVEPRSNYTISFDKGDICWVYLYDAGRSLINATAYGQEESISEVTINTYGAKYLRFMLLTKSETYPESPEYVAFAEPKVTISGIFDDGLKIAKLGKQNDTCDTTIYPVWIENTYCCEDTTTDLQDTGEWHIDFGRIRFPENYDPDGEPVRMIIWCHGGTPRYNPVYSGDSNYNYVAGNFDTQGHINPTLFLAEGYVVMDIDGVFAIFNEKANELNQRPNALIQTAHCYQAAYDFVTKNYNIKTDGVLLGGVSYGGEKSLQIIKNSHIPVIAAALESPFVDEVLQLWRNQCQFFRGAGIRVLQEIEDPRERSIAVKSYYNQVLRVFPIFAACHVTAEEFFATTYVEGKGNLSFIPPENTPSSQIITWLADWSEFVVSKWSARFHIPIKIWCCTADTTSVPRACGQMLYAVGSNGGSNIELRMITGGSHTPSTGGGTGQLNISNYVTKYGQTLATVPLVYAEAIRFWRRYEQD